MVNPSSSSSSEDLPTSLLGVPLEDIEADFVVAVIDKGSGDEDAPVFCCISRVTGRTMACKRFSKETYTFDPHWLDREACIKDQFGILAFLRGLPNVVRLDRAYEDAAYVHLVTEFCSEGTLATFLSQSPDAAAESQEWQEQMQRLFAELATALHWCHLLGVCHNDLTVNSVGLQVDDGKQLQIKIADFERSVFFGISKVKLERGFANVCMDAKNLGPILYSMLSGILKTTRRELERAARRGELSSKAGNRWLPTCTTDQARNMLDSILLESVTMTDILNHPWIKHLTEQRELPELFRFLKRWMQAMRMKPHERVLMGILGKNIPEENLAAYRKQLRVCSDPPVSISPKELVEKLRAIGMNLDDFSTLLQHREGTAPAEMLMVGDCYLILFSLIPASDLIDEGYLERSFAFIDSNKDKIITKGDLESAIQKLGERDHIYQDTSHIKEFCLDFKGFKNIMAKLS